MAQYTVEQLQAVGGSLWEKGEMRRVYFNDILDLAGLDVSTYQTGNVSSARLHGQTISNNAARKLGLELVHAKLWYDLGDGKFWGKAFPPQGFTDCVAELKRRIGALVEA